MSSSIASEGLASLLVILSAGILGVALGKRLKLNPILGYFLAGTLIGPTGLGLIPHHDLLDVLGEIGVAFLLFDIGIHLSFGRLWEARQDLFILGPLQILLCLGIFTLILNMGLGLDVLPAFVVSSGLALSSTAVVLQVLKDRQEEVSPLGRTSTSILISQDLFVVFLLVLLPALSRPDGHFAEAFGMAFLKVVLAFVAVAVIGRYLLRPVFEWITNTKSDEVFTGSALLFVLAIAWLTSQLGLSLPLGAFMAGMAISESDFCYLVKAEIQPFRGLLLGLFFMTVGMTFQWPLIGEAFVPLMLAFGAMILVKTLVLALAGILLRRPVGFSLRLGLALSQGSEFTFVLYSGALASGIFAASTHSFLTVLIGLSLALAPLFIALGAKLAYWFEREVAEDLMESDAISDQTEGLKPGTYSRLKIPQFEEQTVIITGFDKTAQDLARILQMAGISYQGYDRDPNIVALNRSLGFTVDFSDVHRPRTASMVTAGRAWAVVILLNDNTVFEGLTQALKRISPALPLFGATTDMQFFYQMDHGEFEELYIKDEETAYLLGQHLLRATGRFEELEIQEIIERVRERKLVIR
jgi:monovalent cation:H+ antiporter-2, CPA2 family